MKKTSTYHLIILLLFCFATIVKSQTVIFSQNFEGNAWTPTAYMIGTTAAANTTIPSGAPANTPASQVWTGSGNGDANSIWHRDDYQGSWASNSNICSGGSPPAPCAANGTTYSALFDGYDAASGNTGYMQTPTFNLPSATYCSANVSFYYYNQDETQLLVQMWNGSSLVTIATLGNDGGLGTWTLQSFSVPAACLINGTYIRFTATSAYGLYPIGVDEIVVTGATACSGTPAGGTALASVTSGCTSYSTNLSLSGSTSACGITYQWYSSPDNITYTSIAGATSSTYTPTVSSSTYYHCVVKCTGSGLSGTSSSVFCNVGAAVNDNCASPTSLGTINTSTVIAGNNSCATADQTSGQCWTYSKNVWYSFTSAGGTYSISVTQGTMTYPSFVLYSGSCGSLTTVDCQKNSSGSSTQSSTETCLAAGNYLVMVDDHSGSGGVAGTFSLNITQTTSACSGTPTGTTVASTTTIATCAGGTTNLSLSGASSGCGISYQWQSSPDGATWSNVSGQTSTTYTPSLTSSTYYQCYITCSNSGLTHTTTAIEVTLPAGPANDLCNNATNLGTITTATISGTNLCASGDQNAGSCFYNGSAHANVWYTFTTGAVSGTASFSVTAGTIRYPEIAVYSGSCGFLTQIGCNKNNASSTSMVTLSLTCLAPNTTYYIQVDNESGQNTGTFSLITSYNANGCAGTPAGGTASASVTSFTCGGGVTSLSESTTYSCGLTYQWQSSASNAGPWSSISGATSSTYSTNIGSTTYYHCLLTCSNSGLSSTSSNATVTVSGAAANDNFANATALTVNAAAILGNTTCTSLQQNESVACNSNDNEAYTVDQSVWYKFTATSTLHYVQINLVTGCYNSFGASVWNSDTGYQVNSNAYCGMITCQAMDNNTSSTGSPIVFELCHLTVGNSYAIQVVNSAAGCGASATFSISVSTTNSGAIITNPCTAPGQTSNYLTSPIAECYINACTTAPGCPTCPTYTVNGTHGTNELNIVWNSYYSFTTATGCSNDLEFQQCVLASAPNCSNGNVDWLSFQLYTPDGKNCITSGDLTTGVDAYGYLGIPGVGCTTSYILQYTSEQINCTYYNFTPFTDNYGSSSCVLPITLTRFTAAENNLGYVDLNWATANELNNDFFTISRSLDAQRFTPIGTIKSVGNSEHLTEYTYTDTTALEIAQNTLYYRLTQTDFNGNSNNFNIVEVNKNRNFSVSLYPNPSNGDFNLDFTSLQGAFVQVDIMDANGAPISSKLYMGTGGLQHQKIQLPEAGVYFLNLKINGQSVHKKIVKL